MTTERTLLAIVGGALCALAAQRVLTALARRSNTQIHHGGPGRS